MSVTKRQGNCKERPTSGQVIRIISRGWSRTFGSKSNKPNEADNGEDRLGVFHSLHCLVGLTRCGRFAGT